MSGSAEAVLAGANPYVGPRPFEQGEKLWGRDRETRELGYLLNVERIVLLEAASSSMRVVRLLAEDPTDGELFENVMHFDIAFTADKIHCQCQGGGSIVAIWKNDGAFVLDATPGEITCTTEAENGSLSGDVTFAAGSDADLLLGTKTGQVDVCEFFMYVTQD